MRAITRRLSAAGVSEWIFLDHRKDSFQVGLAFIISSGATLTGKVQHTFDHPHLKTGVTIARVTTVATVTKVNHGLVVGDYIVVEFAGAPFDGQFSVASVVNANSFTYTVPDSGAAASSSHAMMGSARVFDHESLVALSANADGNYAFPAVACRLNLTAYTGGFADLVVVQTG